MSAGPLPASRAETARRGRPRKYANAAEKSRAYRLRRKLKYEELAAKAAAPATASANEGKPKTGKELLDALTAIGFVGMWKDRTDIGDSVEFARRLGHEAERRERD